MDLQNKLLFVSVAALGVALMYLNEENKDLRRERSNPRQRRRRKPKSKSKRR